MINKHHQRGYALLLVLLLLSIFISGASALARIVVLNLRQVRFVDQAIIASSAASSGIEYGLYQFRKAKSEDMTSKTDIGVAKVAITVDKKEDTWLKIAKDDFAIITLSPSSGVTSVIFSDWTSSDCSATSWIEVTKTEWDTANFTKEFTKDSVSRQPYSISDGLPDQTIDSAKLTQLRLKALYCDVSKIVIQGQPVLLPSRVIIKSVGEYQGTKQAQQVGTLEKEPLMGLFDYVLFSECSLNQKGESECP